MSAHTKTKGMAADGKTGIVSVPGHELLVSLVAFNGVVYERYALKEINAELLEALKDAAEVLEIASAGGGVDFYAYAKTARAAIAKAEGEMK